MAERTRTAPPPEPDPWDMDTDTVDIDQLVLDDRNARKGDVAAIVESLREFGQHRAVVAQRGTNKVIAGNHLVMAAKVLGWKKLSVNWRDDDDVTAIRRGLADNFVGDRAKWDDPVLRSIIEELGTEAVIPGLDDKQIAKLMKQLDEDDPVMAPTYPIVARTGEAYQYVIVVATNEIDVNWLDEVFGVRKERSYKSERVQRSRVVTVERLRQEWAETDWKP